MIKITDIEAYLNSPHEADIDLWSVDPNLITEVQRVYGGEVYFSPNINNTWYTINSGNVTLTLNTKKLVKSEAKLPEVDLNFLNIKP